MGREIKSNIATDCKFKDIPIYKSISAGYGSYENEIENYILNGCAYLKRLCEKEGEMVLRSDNSYYDDIEIKASDDFTIVGLYKGTLSIAK